MRRRNNKDRFINNLVQERDAAREKVTVVQYGAKRVIEFFKLALGERNQRIARQLEEIRHLRAQLPGIGSPEKVIEQLTYDLNNALNRKAELEERAVALDDTIVVQRHNIDTLKAECERLLAVNERLSTENVVMAKALNLLES